jgi:hypothetical protein
MTTIEKINDNTVAEVGTREVRKIFGKADLVRRKQALEEQLAKVDSLLAVLP